MVLFNYTQKRDICFVCELAGFAFFSFLRRLLDVLRLLGCVFAALPAKLLHLFKRFFAVLGGFARGVAHGAAEVGDNKFCFCHI